MEIKPKNNNNVYFGKELEQIIKHYNYQTNSVIRQDLFNNYINEAFKKVASSLVNKYKIQQRIQNSQTMVIQCIGNMVEKMKGFNFQRGKAFTYFTVIARNYILSQLDKNIKYNQKFKSITQLDSDGYEINLLQCCSIKTWEDQSLDKYNSLIMDLTLDKFNQYIKKSFIPNIRKKNELNITHAILQIINDVSLINNFNKKAIMVYISQMTNQDPNTINKLLKKLGKQYFKIKQQVIQDNYDSENFIREM